MRAGRLYLEFERNLLRGKVLWRERPSGREAPKNELGEPVL